MSALASVVLGWVVMMAWMWLGVKLMGEEPARALGVAIGGFAVTVTVCWWAGVLT